MFWPGKGTRLGEGVPRFITLTSDDQIPSFPQIPSPSPLPGAFIDPTFFLSRAVSNVISSIVFGDRFDWQNKEFLSLLTMMLKSFQFTSTSTGQVTGPNMALRWNYLNSQRLPHTDTVPQTPILLQTGSPTKSAFLLGQLNSYTGTQDRCPISGLQYLTIAPLTKKERQGRKGEREAGSKGM